MLAGFRGLVKLAVKKKKKRQCCDRVGGPGDLQVNYQPGNFPKKNWRAYLNSSFKALEQAFSR